jgi:hypothetical protein
MRGLRGSVVAVVVAACLVVVAPPADAAKNAPQRSTNWSGYAVPAKPGETITEVRGSWHVPSVKPAPPGLSSSWIGVGGYATGDLIQVGTASSYADGHHAWYEMLPAFETPITSGCAGDSRCRVTPGDRMTASVTNVGGDTWTLLMANLGKGGPAKWHWAKTVTYKSSRSSAEWIFEAPQIGLPSAFVGSFRTPGSLQTTPSHAPHAKFLGGDYVANGVRKPLAPGGAVRIAMYDFLVALVRVATPSLMAPDGHFQVCAYKTTCPNF